jgi:hypothetical protein
VTIPAAHQCQAIATARRIIEAHVIAEFSQHLRGGFGQWWDNLNGTDLSNQTRQYGGLVT